MSSLILHSTALLALLLVQDDPVTIRSTRSGVFIYNNSPQTVYYSVFVRQKNQPAKWEPCDKPSECLKIYAGNATFIPYNDIGGYKEGDDLFVVWWNLVRKPAGENYEAVNLTSRVVGTG